MGWVWLLLVEMLNLRQGGRRREGLSAKLAVSFGSSIGSELLSLGCTTCPTPTFNWPPASRDVGRHLCLWSPGTGLLPATSKPSYRGLLPTCPTGLPGTGPKTLSKPLEKPPAAPHLGLAVGTGSGKEFCLQPQFSKVQASGVTLTLQNSVPTVFNLGADCSLLMLQQHK